MTIRNNWCEDCQEDCTGHARVCTMCGGALTTRPTTSTSTRPPPSFRAMPDLDAFLPAHLNAADVLASVRQQVQATTALAREGVANNPTEWQAIPEALLDPQSGGGKTPTQKQVLKKLPREKLHSKSANFFQVLVELGDGQHSYKGVTGELGALPSLSQKSELKVSAPLWIPSTKAQRTGKEPLQNAPEPPFVAVLERGDGISFFTKAYAAECLGAVAVLIVNDKAEPWPYVMKDSRSPTQKEAQGEVSIPTVLLSQANGRDLLSNKAVQQQQCSLSISHNPQDHATCVVCREALQLGQTTLTLTNYCGHVFHETCALQWLEQHNTCPYCRRSLPTEEAGQEQERLRQMTAGDSGGDNNGDGFYS